MTLGAGRVVRLGTYGDPAAIPSWVWDQLLTSCATHLAYTHQSGFRPDIAMQSADTKAQAVEHWNNGRRTFRVITDLGDIVKVKRSFVPQARKPAGGCNVTPVNYAGAIAPSLRNQLPLYSTNGTINAGALCPRTSREETKWTMKQHEI